LRVQIIHIIQGALNVERAEVAFKSISKILCREYEVFQLQRHFNDHSEEVFNFFLEEKNIDKVIDVIELTFKVIVKSVRDNPSQDQDSAIEELNARFKEHGVGYQFEQSSIIRVDSELLHAEVVKPLLAAMSSKKYKPALDEFHSAHEHYRHKRNKECLNECLKAFESTMKIICNDKGWAFDKNAASKQLIKVLFDNNFFPSYMQTQISAIKTLLESGTPTLRNKNSGHGQGLTVTVVEESMASYCHLTATNLLFMGRDILTTKWLTRCRSQHLPRL